MAELLDEVGQSGTKLVRVQWPIRFTPGDVQRAPTGERTSQAAIVETNNVVGVYDDDPGAGTWDYRIRWPSGDSGAFGPWASIMVPSPGPPEPSLCGTYTNRVARNDIWQWFRRVTIDNEAAEVRMTIDRSNPGGRGALFANLNAFDLAERAGINAAKWWPAGEVWNLPSGDTVTTPALSAATPFSEGDDDNYYWIVSGLHTYSTAPGDITLDCPAPAGIDFCQLWTNTVAAQFGTAFIGSAAGRSLYVTVSAQSSGSQFNIGFIVTGAAAVPSAVAALIAGKTLKVIAADGSVILTTPTLANPPGDGWSMHSSGNIFNAACATAGGVTLPIASQQDSFRLNVASTKAMASLELSDAAGVSLAGLGGCG